MDLELKSLVENFLSENTVKLEEVKRLSEFPSVIEAINKKYENYEMYIKAFKEGIVDLIQFSNGDVLHNKNNEYKYWKYDRNVPDLKEIKTIVLTKESLNEGQSFYDETKKEINISFVDHKIQDISNDYFEKSMNNLQKLEIERLPNESDEEYNKRKQSFSSNKLGGVFKADMIAWLVTRVYSSQYESYRPNYEQYVIQNKDPKEFIDFIVSILRDYAVYKQGVTLQYRKPNDTTYFDLKPKITIDKKYSDLNAKDMSIQSVIDAIREVKERGDQLVIDKQNSFKTETVEEEQSQSNVTVGNESSLKAHVDSLIEKYPYHNKGDGLNYKLPGVIKQYGNYTLIAYTSVEDTHYWSKPTHNSSYAEKNEPLANASNPNTGKEGSWKNPSSAKSFIQDMSKEELQGWINHTVYPFPEFGGSSWCTSRLSHAESYKSKGSIYLIMKDFLKLLQYAPSQSQFEYADTASHLDLTKTADKNLIQELVENVPPFVDHCVEGGKDSYIQTKDLKKYLVKRKYLPSINSYLRLHNEKSISDKELIDYLSNVDLVINEDGLKLGKKLYQLQDHFGSAVDSWENIADNLMQDFVNVCNNAIKENNDDLISKVIVILGHIIEGTSNAFIKYRFNKSKKGALDFFTNITKYMIENHPTDKSTIELLSKFSDIKSVNIKSVKELDDAQQDIIKTAKEITNSKINYFSGEMSIYYYSIAIAKNFSKLLGSDTEPELVTEINKFFKDNNYNLDSEVLTELPSSFTSGDASVTKRKDLEAIVKKYEKFYLELRKKVGQALTLDTTNATIKNSRNLLLDALITSKADISNDKFLENIEKTLRDLKISIENTNVYIQLFDPDYFDADKDPNLKGLSLLVSILNKKHEVVDFASVKGGTFSVTDDLSSSGVVKPDENGKFFLSKAQYDFLNKKINTYLQKKVFKTEPNHLTLTDSDYKNVKSNGIVLKDINPLQLFLERIRSNDIPSEFKQSLIDIFNESMDKKVIASFGNVVSDFYKNVGDYIYSKIDLTELYEEFKSKYSK